MKPVAVVTTHPIQYQTPLYRYLTSRGIPLRVLFLSNHGLDARRDSGFGQTFAWDIPLLDGLDYEFVANLRRRGRVDRPFGLINPGLLRRLRPDRFSAVLVHGYRSLSMLMAIVGGWVRDLPVLYRAETTALSQHHRAGTLRAFSLGLRRVAAACLPIGTLNDEFYASLGYPDSQRFLVPYAVDNDRFQAVAARVTREHARAAIGLPKDDNIVLFSGKLIPAKSPATLLSAFAEAAPADSHLVFVGDGVMMQSLRDLAERAIPGRATFLGFVNQRQIPFVYRSADLLVLPSQHEPWGLVVNEAMNFETPAIVSDRVGCGPDLVIPGVTGDVFESDSGVESLASRLAEVLHDRDRLRTMGRAARDRISRWGFAECEVGLRAALSAVGAV